MNKQQKVNSIARTLGTGIVKTGLNLIKTAFHLDPVEYNYNAFKTLVSSFTGAIPVLLDSNYYLVDWNTWNSIIVSDWTDSKQYVKDKYDCDNYSFSFCSHTSYLYGLNSKAAVYGAVYNKNTGKLINYHYWVAIITKDKELYWLETQTDQFVKDNGGKIIIGNMEYRPINLRFY